MIRFLDGPAIRQMLMLTRAPLYLRVTENPRARTVETRWFGLDGTETFIKPHCIIFAYMRTGPETWHRVAARGSRCIGPRIRSYAVADYRLLQPQPAVGVMRDPEAWRAWCSAQVWDEVAAATATGEPK